MKRSNIYLIILLIVLVIPFLWFRFTYKPHRTIVSFNKLIRVLDIQNPNLNKADIVIDPANTKFSWDHNESKDSYLADSTYIYYQLENGEKYTPAATTQNDTLFIGKVTIQKPHEVYKLKLHMNGLEFIILNGDTVWKAPYATKTDTVLSDFSSKLTK